MRMNTIEARRTWSTAEAWIEIMANDHIVAGLIELTLIHIVAGGAIAFVATWTGDALKVWREAHSNALDT